MQAEAQVKLENGKHKAGDHQQHNNNNNNQQNPPNPPQENSATRNHLIPKKWRPMCSKDFIYNFFAEYVGRTPKDQHLELEIRLGRFEFKPLKRINADIYLKVLKDLSIQNPIIVGSSNPAMRHNIAIRGNNTFLNEISHRFNPQVSETLFMSRLEFIKKSKRYSEMSHEFTIDFIPKGKNNSKLGRFTADLQRLKFSNLYKDGKTNIDIMHQRLDYRISGAYEKKTDLKREDFLRKLGLSGIGKARVKLRTNFRFQFLEFSFTRVFDVNSRNNINELMHVVRRDVPENLEELKSLTLFYVNNARIQPIHELEIEVIDVDYLTALLKTDFFRFRQIVDRLVRNAEILSSFPDQFVMREYHDAFKEKTDRVEFPVIGEYFNQIMSFDD